jgi:glycosyltransferase involved in cell wall biosynthesis
VNVLQVNFDFDRRVVDADELLSRYTTLTGWSEALVDAGAEQVTVLQRFHRHAAISRNGVNYVFYGPGSLPPIRSEQPHIAHVNGLGFPWGTALLSVRLPRRTAIVVQDHGSGPPASRSLSRIVWRRPAMRAIDAFLFTASEQAEPWRAAGLIGPAQAVYEVLEGSTTLSPLPRERARRVSGLDGSPALLWVGRLNANKDPLTVLDGFERCLSQLPDAVLTMVFGEVDLLAAVQERLRASMLARHVRLVGRVPHDVMPAFYSAADLFVLGSHHEGSGYALIEACACGAVPVVTGIPAFRVITGNGSHGALWTPGDGASFARAVVDVAHRDLTAARAAVASHFSRALSWPAVGKRAIAVYKEVALHYERS